MKKEWLRRKIGSILITACALWGWMGSMYPQFTLLDGTFRIVAQEETRQQCYEEKNARGQVTECESEVPLDRNTLYWDILRADRSQIRIKFKLLEELNALQSARSDKKDADNR